MTISKYQKAICLDRLIIDSTVQRVEGVDEGRVKRMAEAFNPNALGTLIVSERANESLVCLDGAHRRAAGLQADYSEPVDCIVFVGLSEAEEAGLFLLYNDKKDPSAMSRFKARVVAGDPVAQEISRIVAASGWRIGLSGDPGYIAAVQKLEAVYRHGGRTKEVGAHPEILKWVLDILAEAWIYEQKAADGMMLFAMGQLLGRFGEQIDTRTLVAKLRKNEPTQLIARARGLQSLQGGGVPAALAKIIVGEYNKGRRANLLPDWAWIR